MTAHQDALVPGDEGYSMLTDRHPAAVFIRQLHLLLGHETTARFLGEPDPGRAECLLCKARR